MAEHNIPKGASLDTLHEILAGWSEAGAAEEPRYTADVEEVTSVSDVVGRQTRFLEEIGVLEPHKQQHELTDPGQELASALAEGDEERAREQARELLSDWDLTRDVRGVLEDNPMEKEELVPLGVDLNVDGYLAVTSTGAFFGNADYLNHKRDEYERRRGNLQQTGTRSAHLTIKSIGSRFARWSADYLTASESAAGNSHRGSIPSRRPPG